MASTNTLCKKILNVKGMVVEMKLLTSFGKKPLFLHKLVK